MSICRDYSNFLKSFNSAKFKELWDAQHYILENYSEKYYNLKDLAIELPTGGGKTLIALLISEAWRKENKKGVQYNNLDFSLTKMVCIFILILIGWLFTETKTHKQEREPWKP